MAYVIWKIFMKQYSRFRFDMAAAAATSSTSSSLLLIRRHHYQQHLHLLQPAIAGNPNISNNNDSNNVNNNNNTNTTGTPEEGEEREEEEFVSNNNVTPLQLSQGSNSNNNSQYDNNLAEVLVVNDTKIIDASSSSFSNVTNLIDKNNSYCSRSNSNSCSNNNEGILSATTATTSGIAPIAREEDAEVVDDDDNASVVYHTDNDDDCVSNCCQIVVEKSELEESEYLVVPLAAAAAVTTANSAATPQSVQRSKSRVRTYLKKCKDRLTGQHHHAAAAVEAQTTATPQPTTTTPPPTNNTNISNDIERQLTAVVVCQERTFERSKVSAKQEEQLEKEERKQQQEDCLFTSLGVIEEDEICYEDIDFGLSSPTTATPISTIKVNVLNVNNVDEVTKKNIGGDLLAAIATSDDIRQDKEMVVKEQQKQLNRAIQMESSIATLIDSYLSCIYPVYFECTRAILIRQARDLLVCSYYGCLQTFEQKFLCKFAEIAKELRQKHLIGESLLWSEGWPLATPTGEVVLHLGALDDALLRSGDIYLCVKTVDNSDDPPKLHAVWRSTNSEATIKSVCIDYIVPKAYLSILTLEMLSGAGDDLPQLLQNLLVGVERTIGRITLNELQIPNIIVSGEQQQQQQHTLAADESSSHNNNNNGGGGNSLTLRSSNITNSPKCALRRSELITKNKMLNNKFMLRRLTNRQDSMNSTSSGNSCGSSGSASSDELFYCNIKNNNNNNNNSHATTLTTKSLVKTSTESTTAAAPPAKSTSPALPLFCLGNSFPHIDSDEENPDEKRNSLEADQFENEVIPPSSITEIPEKLLLSGIHLPGTRDYEGNPIVTIDAESVMTAGLNCYEVATVLLYYSTIPERNLCLNATQAATATLAVAESTTTAASATTTTNANNNNNTNSIKSNQKSLQPAQKTFTILIAIEKSQHMCVIDLICQSLKLLTKQIEYCEILAVCLDRGLLQQQQQQQQQQLCKNSSPTTTTTTTTVPAAATTVTSNNNVSICNKEQQQQQQQHLVKFISVDEVTTSVAPSSQIPYGKLQGLHHHDARKWREFFIQLEPFHRQCTGAGQRLVAAMSDIRSADLQGLPTRRQLYAQHRALSRALMDSELHNLRKRGASQLARLQELVKNINSSQYGSSNGSSSSNVTKNNNSSNINKVILSTTTTALAATATLSGSGSSCYSFTNPSHHLHHHHITYNNASKFTTMTSVDNTKTTATTLAAASSSVTKINNNNGNSISNCSNNNNIDVAIRLHKVTLLFNEVDRAAKRLEQLTEQRRERLRELTRQRALEDEINEVTSWITSDGNETLQRFANLQLDCETTLKEHEQEFEKYYFISMKHLAKGRDLHDAATKVDALHESANNLKSALDCFAEKLEQARERIEGASRLCHLLSSQQQHTSTSTREGHLVQQEMQRLAESIGIPWLLEKYEQQQQQLQHQQQSQLQLLQQSQQTTPHEEQIRVKPNSLNLNCSRIISNKPSINLSTLITSTPTSASVPASQHMKSNRLSHRSSSGNGSFDGREMSCHCWRESRNLDDMDEMLDATNTDENGDEEEQSKIADSGLGGCDRCEGNPKLTRICSCQSLNEAGNLYDKSHNGDELDDECFERPSKRYLDIHSPMEANAHLQCHASNFDLPKMEELSCLDPKIQKTLLLIMREMIGTERDYVRSLYYVIENYVDELLRDDIPQPLRGQRNVIFGNIEKIFEFHNAHFLSELERYERYPLKVGAAFLEMESKFYLYALYNKNKPKSDTLMSEYGTRFFKPKQFELNDKMDLASYLLKPVQRMGKYALLLQQLVKACSTVEGAALQEIAADVEELQRAEEMVKFQLRHGNDLLAMDSLRDCDVNVKEQGRLMRQNEFLVWQGRGGKKSLRQIFLFEELVLFSKARRFPDHKNLDIYIYKNSIKTSDIGLTAHIGDSPTKFEIWFRKRKPEDTWTLQCMSEDIKNAWTEEVSKILWKQAKRNREIRLAEMSSMGIGSKPCLDIRPSNNQINDRSITITQLGKAPKLRHSFAGLHAEPGKSTRRPNSLISESSLSSGTSSSSLSTGSSSGHERLGGGCTGKLSLSNNNHALELINETQALMLSSENGHNNNNNTNTLSSVGSGSTSSGGGNGSGGERSSGVSGGNMRNHKRSTTLVSQLSMESGILSDISMTPDQEQQPDMTTSSLWSTTASATTPTGGGGTTTTTTMTTTVVMRHHKINNNHNNNNRNGSHNSQEIGKATEIVCETISSSSNPYFKDKEESINL